MNVDTNEKNKADGKLADLSSEIDAAWGMSPAGQRRMVELLSKLESRLAAVEAAQQPAPVASWLEQAVNLLAQFASEQQGEWASVQPVQIPDGLLPWRELEDGLTDLADEIAAATAPTPAAETPAPAPVETMTISRADENETLRRIIRLERALFSIATLLDLDELNDPRFVLDSVIEARAVATAAIESTNKVQS